MLGDVEKIRVERRRAKANKSKYQGQGNDGGMSFVTTGGSRYGGFGSETLGGGGAGGGGGGGSSGYGGADYDAGDSEFCQHAKRYQILMSNQTIDLSEDRASTTGTTLNQSTTNTKVRMTSTASLQDARLLLLAQVTVSPDRPVARPNPSHRQKPLLKRPSRHPSLRR